MILLGVGKRRDSLGDKRLLRTMGRILRMQTLETVRGGAEYLGSVPWLLMAAVAVPLVWLAVRRRVFPSVWWLGPLGVSLVLAVVTIFVPGALLVTAVVDLVLLIVVVVDAVWVGGVDVSKISVDRSVPRTCSIGVPTPAGLVVRNGTAMTLRGRVVDDAPESFEVSVAEHDLLLEPGREMTASRRVTPGRRGAFEMEHVYLQFASPMRFWNRQVTIDLPGRINVYPDMKQLSHYALLARTNRLSQIGVRRTRRIGQDSDFERLRDYSRDDNYRHIDWRSTAKRRKLTVREFQADQSQRIVFMLDCGRMMTGTHAEDGERGLSLLDHALNSMLMLAYVALQQGDSVGLLCFGDKVEKWLPPRGGRGQMNRLIEAGFDQFPRMVESRYDDAFLYLSQHCKRRSMVVLATNVIDEVNASAVVSHLTHLRGDHLPLALLLRDRDLFEAADGYESLLGADGEMVAGDAAATMTMYRSAVAADILLWREEMIRDLRHRGALVVDALPDEMTAPLVNQYLEVKAKHLL